MKTLRTLSLLFIVLCFTFNTANSQPVMTERAVNVNFYIPCVHEYLRGVVIFYSTVWDNQGDESAFPLSKQQIKYEGTLIGRTSGLEYTIDFIGNTELHDNSARATTFTRTLIIRQDGKLIARLPITSHTTINANGEETV